MSDEIDVGLVAEDLLCGDTCRELLDRIHDKIEKGKGVISFAAVMAGLQKAIEIGIAEGHEIGFAHGQEIGFAHGQEIGFAHGQEIGKELANDRIAAMRPSAN